MSPDGGGGGAPASPGLHPTDERGERGGAAARNREEGENRYRRYALKRGVGDMSPDGGRGGAPASPSLHPTDERGERGGAAARSRGKAKTGTDAMR